MPEHPGFGGSDDPPWIRNVPDLAMFYLDFIEEQGLDRIHLIGHSLGGWLAAEIADPRPLASPEPHGHLGRRHPRQGPARRATSSSGDPKRRCATSITTRPSPTACSRCADRGADGHRAQEPLHRDEIRLAAALVQSRSRKVAAPHQAAVARRLGRRGQDLAAAYAELWMQRLPDARGLVMVEKCGHAPHVEKADEVIPSVRAFLREAVR